MNTKKEKLLYATYQSFMDQSLGRIMPDPLNEIVSEEAMGFGTAADEKIFGIDGFLKLIRIQKEQSEGLDMTWKIEPVSRYVNAEENLAVFADDIHLTVDVNGEKIKMYLRFSVVMEYTNNKWLVIHWHGSKPEEVQSEEDTFGIENWKQKVEKLEKIISERTADLVVKNHELEIETALERVRAVAMAMRTANDLLEICKIVYTELLSLGFNELRNVMINIHNDDKASLLNYDYSDNFGKTITDIPYNFHVLIEKQVAVTKNAQDAFFEFSFEGEELKQFRELRKSNGEQDDPKLEITDALHYYFFSIGTGSIGISTYSAIQEEKLELLKRFRNVFNLSYQRYTDISKAEAQARESQIQLALERVRARTMAMQHSDELANAASLLFRQVEDLDIKSWSSGFNIWQDDGRSATINMCNPDGSIANPYHLPHTEDVFFIKIFEARQRGDDLLVMETGGKELEETYKYMFSVPEVKKMLGGMEDTGFPIPKFQVSHCAFFSQGYLMFITYEPVPEMWEIFKRFAKVFEQTYTRFLDLQKAEAQTKEAQIETALEKVRSRSLAMHKTDELQEVVTVVLERMTDLNIELDTININIFKEDSHELNLWTAAPSQKYAVPFHLPFIAHPFHTDIFTAKENGLDFFTRTYSFEEKNSYFNYTFEHSDFKYVPEAKKKLIMEGRVCTRSIAITKNAGIIIIRYYEKPFSDSENEILKRFAKVFEQAYTRFLDLQKAEAQAREALIETALERVRSRSMGMQKSEELKEVIKVVYEQFVHLNINVEHTGFIMDYKERDDMHIWLADQHLVPSEVFIPYFDSAHWNSFSEAKEKGTDFFPTLLDFEEKNKFYKDLFALIPGIPEETIDYYFRCPGLAGSTVLLDNVSLYIENFQGIPYTDEENKILMRFGKVFQQTYTRFLDLEKAEAQAREALIETGLEKVRARTMAMQHSNELSETASLLFKQIQDLGIQAWSTGFNVWPENDTYCLGYNTGPDGKIGDPLPLPLTEDVFFKTIYDAKKRGEDFLVFESEGESLVQTYRYMDTLPVVGDFMRSIVASGFELPKYQVTHCGFFPQGHLMFITLEAHPEAWDIFRRFTKVFQQTYTRFLDLQKAEAQTREAQIEAALERTRTQSMIMQHSNELDVTLKVFHEQVLQLNIPSAFSFLWLPDEGKNKHLFWAIWEENKNEAIAFKDKAINYPLDRNEPATAQCLIDWKSEEPVYSYAVQPEGVENYFATWHELIDGVEKLKPEFFPGGLYYVEAFMKYGCFGVMVQTDLEDEEKKILYRFAVEFERTYARFLDLQKAEAQAREAKIEAALERVRSRTMAMQRSDELPEAANLLFQQMQALGMPAWSTGYCIWDDDKKAVTLWMSSEGVLQPSFRAPLTEDSSFINMREAYERGEGFHVEAVGGDELVQHYQYMRTLPIVGDVLDSIIEAGHPLPTFQIFHCVYFSQGFLLFITYEPVPDAHEIFKRFGKVFDQTYTRFLDLQKAEAQAREAQVEAALEKVRSRMMSMHRSDELSETAAHLFAQLNQLGIKPYRCNIVIVDKAHDNCKIWATTNNGEVIPLFASFPLTETPSFAHMYDAWKNKEKRQVLKLFGEERVIHTKYISQFSTITEYMPGEVDFEKIANEAAVFSNFFFKQGFLFIHTIEEMSEASMNIIQRFTNVFEQTYTRFLDLQKAEAQAREAQIEAALEKVRSRTLAMQNSDELADTSIVIFEQLIHLGIEPNRLFIGIINNETAAIEAWATNEDGTKIGNHFTLNTQKNESVKKMYEGWKENKTSITIDMTGEKLQNYFHYLSDEMQIPFKGGLSQKRRIQTIAYFGQGLIGMASPDKQPEATILLLERFAAVFNLTYTRFNDLKIAEAHAIQAEEDLLKLQTEKLRAEDALTNLKAAQKQLVQSEKMASLGELTAGIAHEIQNPLNFVNNFSEVNTELISELVEEVDKGNTEEVKAIAKDIKENSEKINHHGKRAGDIVKGMLQHSRSSVGEKESTDINALADEYLRLSYHGLRAKDKSFNTEMKTDFDESIGKINIIPQDIGRVLLNLYNNAFYAVAEKAKLSASSYQPKVSVQTQKINDGIQITVSDNGNGIPQAIVDKIFHPFFTTKPTGQGTGLGLSLSYDIIKAHGGEVKVESKVADPGSVGKGEGTRFIIQLPIV